jgi:hypothetical protein
MVVWQRLIRFVATDGRKLRGKPILPHHNFDLGTTTASTKLQAKIIVGDDIYDTTGKTKVTEEIVTVKELLGPLAREDVPILRCVGLNYAKHSMWNLNFEYPSEKEKHAYDKTTSQRSRTISSPIPVYLLQTQHMRARPQCRRRHPENLPGRPSRLRG